MAKKITTGKKPESATITSSGQNLTEIFSALKLLLENPEAKELLKNELFGKEGTSPTSAAANEDPAKKSTIKVIEIDESEIPAIEKQVNQSIQIKESFRKERRQHITNITKTCSCGRTQVVPKGSPLDTLPFICNKCLRS